ncbi:MAG: oligosaccharide flippase family protein, partial [Legionellales bacterium]|nr:oligosaccharide flippase family protein [Legionellales bacterium]
MAKETIVRSSVYSMCTKAAEAILSLSLLAILARLLDPKDFGIFAIVLAVQALFQPMLDMGLGDAYIKVDNPTGELKNSFFTLNILQGFFNFLLLLILAPIVSNIYDSEILWPLISVFSITVILISFSRQANSQLLREKRFDSLMKISLYSNIITFLVSVYFAYQNLGVWVLIIKTIVLNISILCLIFFYTKATYKLANIKTIKSFTYQLKFGFKVFINRMLNGIFNASDKFLFGKLFGLDYLGHYSNAQQVSRMTDTHIRMPFTTAIYSHLVRYSPEKKIFFYDKFVSIMLIITSMFAGMLILEGEILFIYFLGDKWIFASKYVQPLGLFGMAMAINGIYIIISMSEDDMNMQIKRMTGAIVLLFSIITIVYIFKLDILTFIYIYSISIFLYWISFLYTELLKYEIKKRFFLKTILFVFSILLVLTYLKSF